MIDVPENVHQELKKLIPTAILREVACFVLYDNHPRDDKKIDIVVCTKNGEVKEFFQRDLQLSLNLNCVNPSKLRILRNNNSKLFYLLATKDELFIISSKEKLQISKKFTNVDRFDVNDTSCSGETYLKVIKKDDAVPSLFDSNFESLDNRDTIFSPHNDEDSLPLLRDLKRKLVEARYSAKCNEKTYTEYLNLHQKVSLLTCQNLQPISNGSIFENVSKNRCGGLKVRNHKPWVKVCNMKIIIMLNVSIECNEPLENIQMLLNNPTIPSLVYTTKIFTRITTSPYWLETYTPLHKPNQECVIIAVMDLEEIKLNVTSRIELSGSISYKMTACEYLLPFENVLVSSLDSMRDEFDALSSCKENDHATILAVLAATEKMELCLRHIRNHNDPEVSIFDLFCTFLQMERVGSTNNVVVYRKSPYHALNGTLLVFDERNSYNGVRVSVHTRSPSQVLALLHCIYDAVPAKIVATTPTFKISATTDEFSHYSEDIQNTHKVVNYMTYATSVLNRSTKILEHLDNSMIKMSESKNPLVQSKIGSHIDLFAGGVSNIKDLKQSLLEEAKKGIDSLMKSDNKDYDTNGDVMIID